LYLNRIEEARSFAQEAKTKIANNPRLRSSLYQLAFLLHDAAGMEEQVQWAAGRPEIEDLFLVVEGYTAAYAGRLGKARSLSSRAIASAERAEEKEEATRYEASAALREALFGKTGEAWQRAKSALVLSTDREVLYRAGLTLALGGDAAQAQLLADELSKRFPEDTIVQLNYLPTLQAQLALTRKDPSKAIEALQAAGPYEFGHVGFTAYPVYLRGEAYLATHQGNEAAAEFKKILGHPGIVSNSPIGALAHLQLARAYVLQGDTDKARAAYQDFLTLWKDADPDIPVFIAAKSEYAKIH
jgi:predicted Zn-dependent protease